MNASRRNTLETSDRPFTSLLLALAIGMLSVGLIGCEQESTMEETAEEVDETMEEASEEMGEAAEEAGDEIEGAADELEDEAN